MRYKRDGVQGWIAPDAITNTLNAERFDGRVITSMRYKRDGVHRLLPHPSVRKKRQLFVVPASGGEPKQLTDLPFDVGGIEWAPDSSYILFSGNEKQDDEYNTENTVDIYSVPVEGGEVRRLVRRLTANPGSEYAPALSPDGKRLAYLFSLERGAETDIMLVDVGPRGEFAGEPRNLTADWTYSPGRPEWVAGGEALRFVATYRGNRHLFELTPDDVSIRRITSGDRFLGGFSTSDDGALMAYTATDPLMPSDLFLADGEGGGEIRLTHLNDTWLSEIDLVPPERLTWKVADGTEIEGWVMRPVGREAGKSYPMILKIQATTGSAPSISSPLPDSTCSIPIRAGRAATDTSSLTQRWASGERWTRRTTSEAWTRPWRNTLISTPEGSGSPAAPTAAS